MSAREAMHLTDEQLDDYADGVMPDAEHASADSHLAACERCRRAVGDTREVLAWATQERAVATAPVELWPLVASQTIHLSEVRRAVIRSMRGVLLVGAIVLVAATAFVTWKVARWTARPDARPSRVETPLRRGGVHAGHPQIPTAPTPPRPPTPPTPPELPP